MAQSKKECPDCGKTHPYFECNQMTPNDKLPADLIKNIWADAERYAEEKVKAINEEHFNIYNAHIAGATAWAHWKVKHDELKHEIALLKELNNESLKLAERCQNRHTTLKDQAQCMADALEALAAQLPTGDTLNYFFAKTELIAARTTLQQFKDGKGKEVENE